MSGGEGSKRSFRLVALSCCRSSHLFLEKAALSTLPPSPQATGTPATREERGPTCIDLSTGYISTHTISPGNGFRLYFVTRKGPTTTEGENMQKFGLQQRQRVLPRGYSEVSDDPSNFILIWLAQIPNKSMKCPSLALPRFSCCLHVLHYFTPTFTRNARHVPLGIQHIIRGWHPPP